MTTSKVVFDISMSLDGFMTAAHQTPDEPMGEGGLRLVEWAFGVDERDRAVLTDGIAGAGAVICGRRTYDTSLPWWGANGPTGEVRLPVFVLTRRVAGNAPDDAVYRFVGGLGEALTAARDAAAGKDVTVMGGAQTGRQFLAAGLVDEVSIHLVPVLLGGGTRMFEDGETRQLESVDVVATPSATHMRYRVVKSR